MGSIITKDNHTSWSQLEGTNKQIYVFIISLKSKFANLEFWGNFHILSFWSIIDSIKT